LMAVGYVSPLSWHDDVQYLSRGTHCARPYSTDPPSASGEPSPSPNPGEAAAATTATWVRRGLCTAVCRHLQYDHARPFPSPSCSSSSPPSSPRLAAVPTGLYVLWRASQYISDPSTVHWAVLCGWCVCWVRSWLAAEYPGRQQPQRPAEQPGGKGCTPRARGARRSSGQSTSSVLWCPLGRQRQRRVSVHCVPSPRPRCC
jgi:hypothetical protein